MHCKNRKDCNAMQKLTLHLPNDSPPAWDNSLASSSPVPLCALCAKHFDFLVVQSHEKPCNTISSPAASIPSLTMRPEQQRQSHISPHMRHTEALLLHSKFCNNTAKLATAKQWVKTNMTSALHANFAKEALPTLMQLVGPCEIPPNHGFPRELNDSLLGSQDLQQPFASAGCGWQGPADGSDSRSDKRLPHGGNLSDCHPRWCCPVGTAGTPLQPRSVKAPLRRLDPRR
mmetsp:Transcript_37782/g.61562  ORF Transcript_37782/g.61562 Transcript_37782/m.61562 type:complete len:230 (-) Transcript_37782:1011-1700(-)